VPRVRRRATAAGGRAGRRRGRVGVRGTLRRLYSEGHPTSYVVPSEEGPHRKYYAVNEAGRALLDASTDSWRSFTDAMDKLLGTHGEEAA
jgi:PadR family transcriptional regulator PadR